MKRGRRHHATKTAMVRVTGWKARPLQVTRTSARLARVTSGLASDLTASASSQAQTSHSRSSSAPFAEKGCQRASSIRTLAAQSGRNVVVPDVPDDAVVVMHKPRILVGGRDVTAE